MSFIAGLLKPFALKILAGVAIAGAVMVVLFGARQAGRNAERVEGMRRQLDNVNERNSIENDLSRVRDPDVAKRLRDKWQRD